MPPIADAGSVAPRARDSRSTRADASPTALAPPADGRDVKSLEKMLKRLGFSPGTVDRHFSDNTGRALAAFQRAVGLEATGVPDARTLSKLKGAYRRAQAHGGRLWGAGQKNDGIEKMERRLKRLGYDPGAVDGVFDLQTANAVRAFKKDDRIGSAKVKTGLAGALTKEAVRDDVRALSHVPYRVRVRPSTVRRLDDRRVERALERERADGTRGLRAGDSSKAVEVVQRTLRRAGFDPKHISGRFDERTEGMVKEFQRKSGLEPTGRVDARTWSKLKRTTIETKSAASPKQDVGERSRAVLETEKKLKVLGYDVGKVDGLYTERTERAADRFRAKRGMPSVDGVGNNTLRAVRKAYRKKAATNLNTVQGCAKFLLRSNNVSFWSGLSTGSDRKNLERLARGDKAFVAATGQYIKPNLRVMQALVDMAKHGPIMINALTGGIHSPNSNHYRGVAVDLDVGVGNAAQIERIANQHGGTRNFERDHIHLDF